MYAGGIWKGDTGRRPRGVGNDGLIGNLLKKRHNAKEVIFPEKKENFIFPNRRWTNQTHCRRSRLENIHFDAAGSTSRRKSR